MGVTVVKEKDKLRNVNRHIFPKISTHGASVIGRSHLSSGTSCQDSFLVKGKGGFSFTAIADGHGSSDLSEYGSRFAVEISQELFFRCFIKEKHNLFNPGLLREVIRNIEKQWRERVAQHFTCNFDPTSNGPVNENVFERYGTTLLIGGIFRNTIFIAQLGDGEIVFVDDRGTAFIPLPPGERNVGNKTESLCEPGASENFKIFVKQYSLNENKPVLILFSTDGYVNSFDTKDDFLKVASDITEIIYREGFSKVVNELEGWLRHVSLEGSGDDITCSVIHVGGIELWN